MRPLTRETEGASPRLDSGGGSCKKPVQLLLVSKEALLTPYSVLRSRRQIRLLLRKVWCQLRILARLLTLGARAEVWVRILHHQHQPLEHLCGPPYVTRFLGVASPSSPTTMGTGRSATSNSPLSPAVIWPALPNSS